MSLWSRLFKQDPKELFLSFNPGPSKWRVVSWNFDLKDPSSRQWTVEVHRPQIDLIEWHKNKKEEVRFFSSNRLIRKRRIPPNNDELKALMNLTIHSTLKFSLENDREFLLSPVSGATTIDYQNEAKALLWIQASFGTLHRALDKIANEPGYILTAALFSGEEPTTKERVLRLIAFNLDIFYYLRADLTLQIVVFDDKNLGQGASKTPSFQQIIKVTKPQFYDEIVKIVHRIATVGEIK